MIFIQVVIGFAYKLFYVLYMLCCNFYIVAFNVFHMSFRVGHSFFLILVFDKLDNIKFEFDRSTLFKFDL